MVGTLTPTRGRYAGYHVADARNFFIIYKYHMRSFIDIIQDYPSMIRESFLKKLQVLTEHARYFGGFNLTPAHSDTQRYMRGWCPYFALALHDMFGWQIIGAGEHFATRRPDGAMVDVRGVMTPEEFQSGIGSHEVEFTREELIGDIESGAYSCGYFNINDLKKAKSLIKKLGIDNSLNEDISKLKYHKSPYEDDPEFSGRIPSTIKYWEDGLTLMSFEGDYIGLRKTVKPTIVEVPHNLMVSGQRRVTRAGVAQYLDNPTGKLPEVDLWQGRYIVLDGHHRIVADTLKGLKTTRCEVRDMNTIYGWEGYILKDIDRTDPEDRSFDWSLELTKRP
jgi:hypothetical protein